MKFKIGPTGDRVSSRILGTAVTLAGHTAFVPYEGGPFELKRMTMDQIKAIPKDRFAVSLIDIEMPTPITMGRPGRKGNLAAAVSRMQQFRRADRTGKIIRRPPTGYIRKPPSTAMRDDDGTKTYTVAVASLDGLKAQIEILKAAAE